jgi:hypothetical protein
MPQILHCIDLLQQHLKSYESALGGPPLPLEEGEVEIIVKIFKQEAKTKIESMKIDFAKHLFEFQKIEKDKNKLRIDRSVTNRRDHRQMKEICEAIFKSTNESYLEQCRVAVPEALKDTMASIAHGTMVTAMSLAQNSKTASGKDSMGMRVLHEMRKLEDVVKNNAAAFVNSAGANSVSTDQLPKDCERPASPCTKSDGLPQTQAQSKPAVNDHSNQDKKMSPISNKLECVDRLSYDQKKDVHDVLCELEKSSAGDHIKVLREIKEKYNLNGLEEAQHLYSWAFQNPLWAVVEFRILGHLKMCSQHNPDRTRISDVCNKMGKLYPESVELMKYGVAMSTLGADVKFLSPTNDCYLSQYSVPRNLKYIFDIPGNRLTGGCTGTETESPCKDDDEQMPRVERKKALVKRRPYMRKLEPQPHLGAVEEKVGEALSSEEEAKLKTEAERDGVQEVEEEDEGCPFSTNMGTPTPDVPPTPTPTGPTPTPDEKALAGDKAVENNSRIRIINAPCSLEWTIDPITEDMYYSTDTDEETSDEGEVSGNDPGHMGDIGEENATPIASADSSSTGPVSDHDQRPEEKEDNSEEEWFHDEDDFFATIEKVEVRGDIAMYRIHRSYATKGVTVCKRFSEFVKLSQELSQRNLCTSIKLPPKTCSFHGYFSDFFLENRRRALESYLLAVLDSDEEAKAQTILWLEDEQKMNG